MIRDFILVSRRLGKHPNCHRFMIAVLRQISHVAVTIDLAGFKDDRYTPDYLHLKTSESARNARDKRAAARAAPRG
jgi:hypothetical protein